MLPLMTALSQGLRLAAGWSLSPLLRSPAASPEPWPAPSTRPPAGSAAGCIKCCSLAHGPPPPLAALPPPFSPSPRRLGRRRHPSRPAPGPTLAVRHPAFGFTAAPRPALVRDLVRCSLAHALVRYAAPWYFGMSGRWHHKPLRPFVRHTLVPQLTLLLVAVRAQSAGGTMNHYGSLLSPHPGPQPPFGSGRSVLISGALPQVTAGPGPDPPRAVLRHSSVMSLRILPLALRRSFRRPLHASLAAPGS